MKGNFTFVSVLMGLVLGVSLAACKGEHEKKQVRSDPVPVSVGKVRQIREQETITVSGTVNAPNSPASVSFLVSGKVVFSGPREGEYVRQGQLLARIDSTDYLHAMQGAEAKSADVDAVLEKTMNPARPEQLEQARITFERAEDEYRRMKMLYESKSLAPNDFLKYKAVYESARQQYEQAKAGGQKEDKEQAKAASRQAVANLRIARKTLSDTTLLRPRLRLYRETVHRGRRYRLSGTPRLRDRPAGSRGGDRRRSGNRHPPRPDRAEGGDPDSRAAREDI